MTPFLLCAIISTVATFSIASGFLCWIISLAALWQRYGWTRFKSIVAMAFLALFCLMAHLWNYHPRAYPDINGVYWWNTDAHQLLFYFLSYFSNGFVQATAIHREYEVGRVFGAALITVLIVAVLRSRKAGEWNRVFPWALLAGSMMAIAGATTIGRIHIPELQPRYLVFSMQFVIAVIALASQSHPNVAKYLTAILVSHTLMWSTSAEFHWRGKNIWIHTNNHVRMNATRTPVEWSETELSKITRVDDVAQTVEYLRILEWHGYAKINPEKP